MAIFNQGWQYLGSGRHMGPTYATYGGRHMGAWIRQHMAPHTHYIYLLSFTPVETYGVKLSVKLV